MNFKSKLMHETTGRKEPSAGQKPDLVIEPVLNQALTDFRTSIQAWSEVAYNRPRTELKNAPRRKVWRLATGLALGCALLGAGVSGGLYEQHHRQEMARIAAAREASQQRLVAEQHAREEEELLAKVDSDISRQVPSAMEPLALLMAEDEAR